MSDENKSVVGLKDLHVALVTADTAAAYTAETPESFAPAVDMTAEPETSLESQYADDQVFDQLSGEGPTKLTLSTTGIQMATLAKYLGKTFDTASGRLFDEGGNATPPDAALSYRSVKSNGKYRYYQYLRGKFSVPGEEHATKEAKATPKPAKIVFTAINTLHEFTVGATTKSYKRVIGDEDSTNFDGSTFFDQVQTPVTTTPDAVALSSSVPTAGGSNISKTAAFTLTFNNAMEDDVINHIALLDATPALVTVTASLDTTKKIVTVTHTALAGSTAHTIVISGATDIYGQVLANTIIKFTTVA